MNFDEIIFKSDIKEKVIMKVEDDSLNLYDEYDDIMDLVVTKYRIDIFSTNKNRKEKTKLGHIIGTLINVDIIIESGIDAYYILDEIGDIVNTYSYFYDSYGNILYNKITDEPLVGIDSNIFKLDVLYIEKEYRNMGLGSKIMKSLRNIIMSVLKLNVGVITFQVEPFEYGENNEPENKSVKDIKKLEKFYEKCGYNKIPYINKVHNKFNQFYRSTEWI